MAAASPESIDFDLVIVGGGLAGASLAVALKDCGRSIGLLESRPPAAPLPTWDARIYAISPASRRFLERIGVWPGLDARRIAPVTDMRIAGDGFGRLRFSAYDSGVDELASIAESSRLLDAHWQVLRRQSNLTLIDPASPAGLKCGPEHATLRLSDGRQLRSRLIVAADGRESRLRALAGLAADESPYGERGVVANFRAELDHRGTAFQWFREDGVLAWLPLPERHISMVWSCGDDTANLLLAMNAEELADAVGGAGADRLGRLETVTPAQAFPLKRVAVRQTTGHRFVVIGDAAHGIHPLSGHGVNLGFSDARELARLIEGASGSIGDSGDLGDTSDTSDIGDRQLLDRYARLRRLETVLLMQGTHALHELFRSRLPGIGLLRNLGLDLTDRLGPVKSLLARIAMG